MRISDWINRIGGDLVHNQVAVALFAAAGVLAVVLMQRGLRTYGAQAVTWSRAKLGRLRAWWRTRRISDRRARRLLRHADRDGWWARWEQQIEAWQRIQYEPPDDPAP